MASTIGRAGKQVFAAIVSPTNPNTGFQSPSNLNTTTTTPSSNSKLLLSQTVPLSSSGNLITQDGNTTTTQRLQSFMMRESSSVSKIDDHDPYSKDWTDLEKTLQECLVLETNSEYLTPNPSLNKQFSTPLMATTAAPSPSPFRSPKFREVSTNPQPGQSFIINNHSNSNGSSRSNDMSHLSIIQQVSVLADNPLKTNNVPSPTIRNNHNNHQNPDGRSYDKEELLAQLEQLKQQNQQLANQIETNRIETQTQLEYERHQKLLMIQSLEQENQLLLQQLMTEKLKSEQILEKEKHSFIQSIKQIEEEKKAYEIKLLQLEESKSSEIGYFLMEKSKMEKQLYELERQQALALQSIHSSSEKPGKHSFNSPNKEGANNLETTISIDAAEREQRQDLLATQLQQMEEEKQQLLKLIQENLEKSQQENQKLSQEIASMKESVHSKLADMEKEKLSLAEKLKQAEENVVNQTNLIQQQIEKQKQQTNEMVESLEREKQQLLLQQQQQLLAPAPLTATPSSTFSANGEATTTNENNHNTSASSLTAPTATKQQIDLLLQEKTQLQEKLKASAEQSKQKVKELSEVIQKRKKKLLMKNMNKIKQNMSNEKLKEPQPPQPASELQDNNPSDSSTPMESNTATTSPPSIEPNLVKPSAPPAVTSPPPPSINPTLPKTNSLLSPASGAFMKSNRSLFDLMTELNQKAAASNPQSGSAGNLFSAPSRSAAMGIVGLNNRGEEDYYEIIGSHNSNYTNNSSKIFNPTVQGHVIERIDEKTFMDADDSSDDEGHERPLTRKTASSKVKPSKPEKEEEEEEEQDDEEEGKRVRKKRVSAKQQNNQEEEQFSDLPAPHAAAAAGDLNRLQAICALDLALLESIDSVGRQPLFYASAHSRSNIVDYILSQEAAFPMLTHADSFGDTPLHAASAGGSMDCLDQLLRFHQQKVSENPYIYQELAIPVNRLEGTTVHEEDIIDYTHNYVNIKNSTGMTSIHLAGNGQCIEKLIEYSGDINLTDIHLRTPLFIACAINKESCVEYLIGYLDHSEDALLQKDYRGDTPLHAAACNGSVETLLLLLQCGIDPRICNDQGLKAIDLAIRNKHHKCKEILAEYHLHYCTSSEFDSVLFLATLEGHRMISQFKQFGGGSKPSTVLNRDPSIAGSSNQPLGVNHTFQSMFSLRSNRTMKLQRYGPWIAYHDPGSHSVFWYNHETQKGQWETPDLVRNWRETKENQDQFDKSLQAKMSMRLKREGDWIQYTTEGGKTFYYNEKTCSFQWEDPFATKQAKSKVVVQPSYSFDHSDHANDPSVEVTSDGDQQQQQHYPSSTEWKPYLDEATGHVFWYNHITKISQWENPFEKMTDPNPIQSILNDDFYGATIQQHDLDAFPVLHENDLDI